MNAVIDSTTKLQDLLYVAEQMEQEKADYRGDPKQFGFLKNGMLTTRPGEADIRGWSMAPVSLTEHARGQAYTKLGPSYGLTTLGCDYMNKLVTADPELFAQNMNRAIARVPENNKGWYVRTYQDKCRAVLSGEYLEGFDNTDMLKLLNDAVMRDGSDHRISSRSYVDPDGMVVDVLFGDIHTGRGGISYKIGARIRNDEIGRGKGGIHPVVKKSDCDNSITTDERAMSYTFVHFGRKTLTVKRTMLRAAISEVLPFTTTIVEAMIEAEEHELPQFSDIVNGLAIKHGWSEAFTGAVFAGSNAQWTLAGLVNGVTFAAHTQQSNSEQMADMEFLGGNLLFERGADMMADAVRLHRNRTEREAAKAKRALREEARRVALTTAEQ